MPEIVNDEGNIVNVSQKKFDQLQAARREAQAAANLPTNAEKLRTTVEQTANSISTKPLNDAAATAISSFNNAGETLAGQVAGQVKGGIQSLTQKADAFKGELTDAKDTVEGLLSGDASSIENMISGQVDKAIGGLLSKFGAKVEIQYGDPDPDTGVVQIISSSLSTDTSAGDKISGILSLITGLGVNAGSLQNVATLASPEGLLDAGKKLVEGKIGAFDGATAITDLATNAITEVTNKLESDVGAAFAAARNVNKTVKQITSIDSDGNFTDPLGANFKVSGDTVFTTTNVNSTGPTDSAEFFAGINQLKAVTSDLQEQLVKSTENARQTLAGAQKDLRDMTGKDGATVLSSVQSKNADRQAYARKGEEYKGIVGNRTGNSESGVVQGLADDTLTSLRDQIKAFAPGITDANVEKVIALSQGDAGDVSKARQILSDASGKTFAEIDRLLQSLDSTISNATKSQPSAEIFGQPYTIGDYQRAWKQGKENPIFPYISSVEELQAEIRFITRPVTTVTVHWTETATNKNIGSEEINDWHLAAGLPGIGYHYVIRRDGSLQRGRPVNLEGDIGNGSLDIIFVGGINAPTGTPNSQNFIDVRSLTRAQFNTFDHFCRAIYISYPGMSIIGHSEFDRSQIDPGFNVTDYVQQRFDR
jgi:hypothetical protein